MLTNKQLYLKSDIGKRNHYDKWELEYFYFVRQILAEAE